MDNTLDPLKSWNKIFNIGWAELYVRNNWLELVWNKFLYWNLLNRPICVWEIFLLFSSNTRISREPWLAERPFNRRSRYESSTGGGVVCWNSNIKTLQWTATGMIEDNLFTATRVTNWLAWRRTLFPRWWEMFIPAVVLYRELTEWEHDDW